MTNEWPLKLRYAGLPVEGSRRLRIFAFLVVLMGAVAMLQAASKEQEIFNQAKVLMFEQNWEGARQTFQRLIREFPQSSLLPQAYYHSAYCLQLQKKPAEAIAAYELFLQKYPKEPVFVGQARQTMVQLASTLFEKGNASYRALLTNALGDPDKQVRYFAAIRCASLKDRQLNTLSVPVLREILAKEKQADLVAPASIALLRIQPEALTPQAKSGRSAAKQADPGARLFHIQIFENGENNPATVELNIPASFAQIAIAALDEATKSEMRKKGLNIDNIWSNLNRMNAANIFTFRNGARVVKIWIQ